MDLHDAMTFAKGRHQGVLATIRRDGRPQLSNIVFSLEDDGVARISVTDDRAKTRNLRRDPRALLYVPGDSFWHYAVLDGIAELTPVAREPQDPTVNELIELYRAVSGEHPDWDEFRTAMVNERRLVIRFRPVAAYGQ